MDLTYPQTTQFHIKMLNSLALSWPLISTYLPGSLLVLHYKADWVQQTYLQW